jgi:hypothetical protein
MPLYIRDDATAELVAKWLCLNLCGATFATTASYVPEAAQRWHGHTSPALTF